MLPRWHILSGAIFTIALWLVSPQIQPIYLAFLFLSSFLIDLDHYLASVFKTKKLSLSSSFEYYRKEGIKEKKEIAKGIKKKSDFHLFHTMEFHIFIGMLSFFWIGFFYIFVGMVFHSLLDIFHLTRRGAFHRREFFFFNWLRKKV